MYRGEETSRVAHYSFGEVSISIRKGILGNPTDANFHRISFFLNAIMRLMAIKKGRGWRGDKAEHQIAGSKGGKATARTHGKDFYARIGSRGGKISGGNFKNNRALA